MGPDGICFEGKGIGPDIAVKTPVTGLQNRNLVLEAALKFLREP